MKAVIKDQAARPDIELNNWVVRVSYPRYKHGFTQTYDHVLPGVMHRVIDFNARKEMITISVLFDGEYYTEKFWVGNFKKVVLVPILTRDDL